MAYEELGLPKEQKMFKCFKIFHEAGLHFLKVFCKMTNVVSMAIILLDQGEAKWSELG